jgi:hypothetical protein
MSDTPDERQPDFHEYVKNPEHRRSMERADRRRKRAPRAEELDEEAIQGLVERFFRGTFDERAKSRVQRAGERAVPVLLRALRDPRVRTARYGERSHALDDNTPLETILSLLEPFGPPEAVALIAPFVKHPDPVFRKYAAYALGNIGSDACVAPLSVALADPDDYVRSFAVMGIQWGIQGKRPTPSFLAAIFDHVGSLLSRKDRYPGRFRRWWSGWYARLRALLGRPVSHREYGNFNTYSAAPGCLLDIDREKATTLLLDPRHFNTSNEYLYRICEALGEADVPLPLDKALPRLSELRSGSGENVDARTCGELLRGIARAGGPEAEAAVREALTWNGGLLRAEAERALGMLEGVKDPAGVVLRRLGRVGFRRLSKPQKVYYCVWLLNAEVRNGGFAQYFVNSSGNLARLARKALAVLGAVHTEEILRRAMSCFGQDGPSGDHDERHEQLAVVYDRERAGLDRLDDEFYEDRDGLDGLLLAFARRHSKHFVERDSGPRE